MRIELFGIKLLEIRTPGKAGTQAPAEDQDLLILRGQHPFQQKTAVLPGYINTRTMVEPKQNADNDHGRRQQRIWEKNREESSQRVGR